MSAAVAADAGEIWTVQLAAFVAVAQRYDDVYLPPLVEPLLSVTAAIEEGRVLVARLDSRIVGEGSGPPGVASRARIVGAVRTRLDDGVCHIGRLVVAPDVHGRGVGSALLSAAEERHRAQVRAFALFTGAGSAESVALYRRHGYVVERTEPGTPDMVHLSKRA
ncbi:GNAT family N-acetyltransferase [Virgisporangium aliadipatigenens]|uniref:GNAT family N-acetyltransferase n=1 Tax=Virgisporangium aliadipatigenens TaxID=741659 RepID=UPI0019404701|nr:GNAT family N-acetyltransferase [Virgisporangium aliadipatigenens]